MTAWDTGSYRDRDSRVFYDADGSVLRGLTAEAWQHWEKLAHCPLFPEWVQSGRVIPTEPVDGRVADGLAGDVVSGQPWAGVLKHQRIPFVSYPFEWPFGMLRAAAALHLDLLRESLPHDITLKDGTAYNVQFRGAAPVFIDIGSFEPLAVDRPWAGYRQFCQSMLYPLMLQAYKGVPFHPWLRGRLDGITPEECWRLMSFRDLFRQGVFTHVGLHARLSRSSIVNQSGTRPAFHEVGFRREMLDANFRKLRSLIDRIQWTLPRSEWSHYESTHQYSAEDRSSKEAFVRSCVIARDRKLTWDIGCNTGTFSRIAAEKSEYVVAMDSDHESVERLYRELTTEGDRHRQRILPLVVNIADQISGLGWRGRERVGLIERGRPELLLALAVVHHLVIGCGLPMTELLTWFAEHTDSAVIEFVAPEDPLAQNLLNRRAGPCPDYRRDYFEAELGRLFHIERSLVLKDGLRTLYEVRAKVAR